MTKFLSHIFILFLSFFCFGCSSTYMVGSNDTSDQKSTIDFKQLQEKILNDSVDIELLNHQVFYANQVQISEDSLSFFNIQNNNIEVIAKSSVDCLRRRLRNDGATEGKVIGCLSGLAGGILLGRLVIEPHPHHEALSGVPTLLSGLGGAIIGLVVGHEIGSHRGHVVEYKFMQNRNKHAP